MQLMGLQAIYKGPNTSKKHPQHPVYPYLLRKLPIIPSCLAAIPGVIPALTSFCDAETVSVSSFGRPGLLPRFLERHYLADDQQISDGAILRMDENRTGPKV